MVTDSFGWSQVVTPLVALSTAHIGMNTSCVIVCNLAQSGSLVESGNGRDFPYSKL